MYQTNHSTDSCTCTRMSLLVSEKNIHCIYNLSAIATFLAFPKTWKREKLLRRRLYDPPPLS